MQIKEQNIYIQQSNCDGGSMQKMDTCPTSFPKKKGHKA